MKIKKILSVLTVLLALMMIAAVPVEASSAYQTYTYSIEGEPLYSPDAYRATMSIDSTYMGLDIPLKDPNAMITDEYGNVYIADTGNNRIVILDRYYKIKSYISEFINDQGVADSLQEPEGVAVTSDTIWVCDTESNRIVLFDREGNFVRIIEAPQSSLFEDKAVFKPVAMAVDQYNRLYVISSTTYQGVLVMTDEGEFQTFIGAPKVSMSVWRKIWRRFQTKEQRAKSKSYVPTSLNSIAMNAEGLIYVTVATTSIDDVNAVASAISAQEKKGDHMPVKLLNSKGVEIMSRNGFWPPAGEIQYSTVSSDEITGPSLLVGVACGPEKTWSVIDSKRSKIYTYDYDGNLLFAFGDKTSMLGSITNIRSITYQDSTMLVMDTGTNNIVVFERTEYGDLLLEAIGAQNSLDYDYAIECWGKVLQHNSNFDAAYVGIGQAYYRSGEYAKALEYYEVAYDTENWSNAYKEARKDAMSTLLLPVIAIIIVVLFLFAKFMNFTGKVNKRVALAGRKPTYWEELAYGFHVMVHPFDGFWDLKHEKRGSIRASLTFIAIAMLTFFYQAMGEGYVMDPEREFSPIWVTLLSVGLPLILFIVGNWCLTTLFDGEGSLKDILIASGYCMVPVPLLVIPATILSNFVTESEKGIITFIIVISFVWLGLLLFFGMQVTHDYTTGKNFITVLGTIIAMAFIMFVAILFTTLLVKLVSLILNLVQEIQYRI